MKLIILFILIPQILLAQDLGYLDQRNKRINSLLNLEIQLLKRNQEQIEDIIPKSITIYEKMIQIHCMPNLHKELQHKSPFNSPLCIEYSKKLKDLSPKNAILLCSENGIESVECANGFKKLYIGSYSDKDSKEQLLNLEIDLNAKLHQLKNLSNINEIESNLKKAQDNYYKNNSEENKYQIDLIYKELVSKACYNIKTSITEKEPPDDKNILVYLGYKSLKNIKQLKKDLETVEKKFKQDKTVEKEEEHIYYRVRHLTNQCEKYIKKFMEFNKYSDIPQCYLQGFYSPQCIEAKRYNRLIEKRRINKLKKEAVPKEGIQVF